MRNFFKNMFYYKGERNKSNKKKENKKEKQNGKKNNDIKNLQHHLLE